MGLGARSVYVFERKGKTAYIGLSFPYAAAAVMYTSGASFLNQYTHGEYIYTGAHTQTYGHTYTYNHGRTYIIKDGRHTGGHGLK